MFDQKQISLFRKIFQNSVKTYQQFCLPYCIEKYMKGKGRFDHQRGNEILPLGIKRFSLFSM